MCLGMSDVAYLKTYRKLTLVDMEDADNWYQCYTRWEEVDTRPVHATIQTILDIPVGESRAFLCLDRNVLDVAEDNIKAAHSLGLDIVPTSVFTKNYYIKFTKTGPGITGTYTTAYSLDTVDNPEDDTPDTDLDIEYAPDNWYPMTDGVLPAVDEQCMFPLLGVDTPWTKFSPDTRVGWRGPMIPLDILDDFKIRV